MPFYLCCGPTLLWSSFGVATKTMVMVGLTSPSFFLSSSLSFSFLPFFYFPSKLPGCSSRNSRRDATRSLKWWRPCKENKRIPKKKKRFPKVWDSKFKQTSPKIRILKIFQKYSLKKIEKNIGLRALVHATSTSMNGPLILTFQHTSLVLMSCVDV
jgi:hypothetical protein